MLQGPLRSLRLATEDPPPAAIAATDLLAQRLCGEEGGGGGGRRVIETAGDVLEAARDDQDLCLACTGWCLKFLFEGEAVSEAPSTMELAKLAFPCKGALPFPLAHFIPNPHSFYFRKPLLLFMFLLATRLCAMCVLVHDKIVGRM